MSEIQTFTFPDLSLKSKTSFSPESLLYLVKIVEFFKTFRNPESRHLNSVYRWYLLLSLLLLPISESIRTP